MCFHQLHNSKCSTTSSSSCSRHRRRVSSSSESEVEISQLEKLLATGSLVILKGSYSIPVAATHLCSTIITSSSSSFVQFVGDGLGEIYREPKPRELITKSSPGPIQYPHFFHDLIFFCPRLPARQEGWLRVQSLPNIHKVFQSIETRKKSSEVETQCEQYNVNAQCSFPRLYRRAGLGQRMRPILWASMHNVGTCSNYFSGGVRRSLPLISPSWNLSHMAIFSGITHVGSITTSIFEDDQESDSSSYHHQLLVGPRHFSTISGSQQLYSISTPLVTTSYSMPPNVFFSLIVLIFLLLFRWFNLNYIFFPLHCCPSNPVRFPFSLSLSVFLSPPSLSPFLVYTKLSQVVYSNRYHPCTGNYHCHFHIWSYLFLFFLS